MIHTDNESIENQLAKVAYRSGLVGTITLLVCTYLLSVNGFRATDAVSSVLFGMNTDIPVFLFILITTGLVMLATDWLSRCAHQGRKQFSFSPTLQQGKFFTFLGECTLAYASGWILLHITKFIYHHVSEYGFQNQSPYYAPFFTSLEFAIRAYVWLAPFYIVITKACFHDEVANQKSLFKLFTRIFWRPLAPKQYKDSDKAQWLGILVKLFFIPLMTVFFVQHLGHAFSNLTYLGSNNSEALYGHQSLREFTKNVYNIGFTFLILIDTGIAWCGYAISSRWIRNQVITADPRILGWAVAILCYPPFNGILSAYFTTPSEQSFLQIPGDVLMFVVCIFSLLAFALYTLCTICFGLRFSNLTHRGVITKGPYAYVRHPAYATKNFAWWCLMFPQIIWMTAANNISLAVTQTLGLIGITWWYYLRALTEEKHLSWDPAYRAYCKQVPYRFLPGVL